MHKRIATALVSLLLMSASFAVEVNTATVADLDGLNGVGPALSRRILEARRQGAFKDWADLSARVKGIKGKVAARLSSDGLTVSGASLEGPAADSGVQSGVKP